MADRILEILSAFIDRPSLSPPEVAGLVDLPLSTTYRTLRKLRDAGFLRTAKDGYRIGPKVLQLAETCRKAMDIPAFARPKMQLLADTTGETILLTTLAGDDTIAMQVVPGSQSLRFTFNVGERRPLHSGASSKIIFSALSEARRERILRRSSFERRTERTVVEPERLRAELDQIRKQGYAITWGEWEEGVLSIAAPVIGPEELWGLSIVGPTSRFDHARIEECARLVVDAAHHLTSEILAADEALLRLPEA